MVLSSRRDYLEAIRSRYRRADREAKSRILDEFCATCGYNRKYAIRLLSKPRKKPAGNNGCPAPAPRLSIRMRSSLKRSSASGLPQTRCVPRSSRPPSHYGFPSMGWNLNPWSRLHKRSCCRLSPATIDRLLKPYRALSKKGRCTTKPGTLLKNQIPVSTHHWDVAKPGYFEADTVAHCGSSMSGDFVYSLTFTDILSGWTENRAVWGRGSQGVLKRIKDIEEGLVFPILGFDCDNGSEFLNHHLVRYFTDRTKTPVLFSRSRPYRKNDNAFVEQKNWTHVRQLLGYERFDKPEMVSLINELYKNEWSLFTNYFCPTLKLKEKSKLNSRYVKSYESPKTPCQRLLDSEHITAEAKRHLQEVYNSLNPFTLKSKIEEKLGIVFAALRLPTL